MKIRLAVALVGLAISCALPTFAQQKDTADPRIAQQIPMLAAKYDEAFNSHDATAVAALFTGDGARSFRTGQFMVGRQSRKIMRVISSVGMPTTTSPRSIG
jgi:hypothetical protein